MQGGAFDRFTPAGGLDGLQTGLDLPLARQENQGGVPGCTALVFLSIQPVALQGPEHLAFQPLQGPRRLMADGHGIAASLAAQHLGPFDGSGQGGGRQGGRHQGDAQFRCQQLACLAHQGQGQIGIGAALVEFIEEQVAHPLQGWIGLQAPQKHAGGDHLDAGGAGTARFQPHAVAHPLAHRFVQLSG